ncbi:hypothetical protein BOTBODRAFT_38282, partial [Botryobasidium botryosum FD-172 SS1]
MVDSTSDLTAKPLHTHTNQPISPDGATSDLNTASFTRHPIQHNSDDENGFQKLDAEYEALEHAPDLAIATTTTYSEGCLSVNRSRRNQLCPIYRLPNEILAFIFDYVGCSPANASQPFRGRAPWNVSQTSKLWREIALGTAILWSDIVLRTVPLAQASLDRSKGALLNVSQPKDMGVAPDVRFLQILRPHINRCNTLMLAGLTPEALAYLTTPAPRLETFFAYLDLDYIEDVVLETSFALPDLFEGHTPQLRAILLGGIPLSLRSALFVGLTFLHLANIEYVDSSVVQLFRNLAMYPLLEILWLERLLFPLADNPNISIDLPRLQDLQLIPIPQEFMRSLLASILISPLVSFDIRMRDALDFHLRHPPIVYGNGGEPP